MTGSAPGAPTTPHRDPTSIAGGQAIAFGVLAVLGAAVLATSFGYGILGEEGRVGPGLLPMVTGLLLLLLAGAQLLVRLRRLRAGADVPRASDEAGEAEAGVAGAGTADAGGGDAGVDVFGRTEEQRVRQLRMVVVALPVTVLLVPLVGFLAAFGLLVLFISAVVERRWLPTALLATALAVAAGYGVFVMFLEVPLPAGVLGDLLGW